MNCAARVVPAVGIQLQDFVSFVPSMMITSTTALAPALETKLVADVYSAWLMYGTSPVDSSVALLRPKFITFTPLPNIACRSDG